MMWKRIFLRRSEKRSENTKAYEVTPFLELSFANEFHKILGQYLNHCSGLKRIKPDRLLFSIHSETGNMG
jgi:hypothetical protein